MRALVSRFRRTAWLRSFPRRSHLALAVALASLAGAVRAAEPVSDSAAVRRLFSEPPVEYAPGALWVWNDLLDEEQVRTSLRELAGRGLKNLHVHPRPGLMTPYLSPDWFKLWDAALDEARKQGARLWIYDENSYPSGFAGGWVPEVMPESRGMGLSLTESAAAPTWTEDTVALFRVESDRAEMLTEHAKAAESSPAGRYVVAKRIQAKQTPWFGNRSYTNLLTPGVAQTFLELTFEPYRARYGAEFGALIAGVFTDEPQIRSTPGLPWAHDLPERFRQRWGYELAPVLPSLTLEIGDWRKVRHNFLQLLNELYVERWAKPYFDYCVAHRLQATGHFWEHEWPNARSIPDSMTAAAWQHRPGIDTLMNNYSDGLNSQFGNARAVREIASVAAQLGLSRPMSEAFGASGWDIRFADLKRIGDWLQALGVNDFVQHYSAISLRGARKRDHPQSFSHHEPWWSDFGALSMYFARLSAVLAQGKRPADVLLLEPTTTGWMYNYGAHASAALGRLGRDFHTTVNRFESAQIEYDLGSEYLLARHGSVHAATLKIGQAAYRIVVLPRHVESLNAETVAFLERFLEAGGQILALDDSLTRVDGAVNPRAAALCAMRGWTQVSAERIADAVAPLVSDGFAIRRSAGDAGLLFHHRRRLADGDLLFLANTSAEHVTAGTISSAATGVERWDTDRGTVERHPFSTAKAGGVAVDFSLPPGGSLLLFLATTARVPAPVAGLATPTVMPGASLEIERLAPNVLTIDFVDITAGGETRKNIYCYDAGQFAFRQNGVAANPWDSAVQFRDELVSRTYAPGSGLEVSYRFTITEQIPADLEIVVERPDLYTITCNGQPVSAADGRWWLDRAFGCVSLRDVARIGENVVTLHASPFTQLHEVEPAYVRGSFRLRAAANGFVIVPDAPLRLGRWTDQGHPFYAEGVRYRAKFDLASVDGAFAVSLPEWLGSVARVRVNGHDAGAIGWAPWQRDVSVYLRRGVNTIEVDVIGTLKNTLGPHHGAPPLGRAWPSAFRIGPKHGRAAGQEYSLVGYGLFEPFELLINARKP